MARMKQLFSLLLIGVFLSGCAPRSGPTRQQVEQQGQHFQELTQSRTVAIVDEPYLGARLVTRQEVTPAALTTHVTLRRKGSLAELVAAVSDMVPLAARVSAEETKNDSIKKENNQSADADLIELLEVPGSGGPGKIFSVSWDGTLKGLLDHLANLSGYGWDYDEKAGTVTFARMVARTFTVMSAPGTVEYSSEITNKSRDNTGSLGGSPGVNQTVSAADTQGQTAQTSTTKWQYDVWDECISGIKILLSSQGSVAGNRVAGTITVRDTPERIRQVAAYMEDTNTHLSRQVALTVHVWALELTDESQAGLNLQALFQNSDVSVVAGNLASFGGTASAAVSIVDGKLRDSSAAVQALRKWGRLTQLTSAGGVLMSNQQLPSLAIKRHAYLAGMSRTENDSGTDTSSVTPGEVTEGFSMTVIPHILDRRRVILQYNINLSSLDDMLEISTDDITVQLPQVSTRSFAQRSTMKMGQTLVLAGFEQESRGGNDGLGILYGSRQRQYSKTLLIITIELESAEV